MLHLGAFIPLTVLLLYSGGPSQRGAHAFSDMGPCAYNFGAPCSGGAQCLKGRCVIYTSEDIAQATPIQFTAGPGDFRKADPVEE